MTSPQRARPAFRRVDAGAATPSESCLTSQDTNPRRVRRDPRPRGRFRGHGDLHPRLLTIRRLSHSGCPRAFGATDRAKRPGYLATLARLALSAAEERRAGETRIANLEADLVTRTVIGQAQGIPMDGKTG